MQGVELAAKAARIGAALAGFIGAVVVSGVRAERLDWPALTPILAAALWAATDVLTKALARDESPETLTVSLLVLITPNHLAILLLANAFSAYAPAAALISQGSQIVPLQIRASLSSETILGRENVGSILALGMIVVMSVVMALYAAAERRASRWRK